MAKYCDTKILEHNWFNWIVATATPQFEQHRINGSLWCKIIKTIEIDNKEYLDLSHPTRLFCINNGINKIFIKCTGQTISQPYVYVNGKRRNTIVPLKYSTERTEKFVKHEKQLKKLGYIKCKPTDEAWHSMLNDINNICLGVAAKFNKYDSNERHDLSHDAFLQVVSKLKRGKLTYQPGRAPVFNLLTTTIYRCICSILSKKNKYHNNSIKILQDAKDGKIQAITHSLSSCTDIDGDVIL